MMNHPTSSFSKENSIWGDMTSQPQLMYQSKTAFNTVEGSVHYINELKDPVVLHIGTATLIEEESFPETGQYKSIFKSKHRIVFEFFDPKTMNKIENKKPFFDVENYAKALLDRHQPIMIEPEGYDCAYVVKNYDFVP